MNRYVLAALAASVITIFAIGLGVAHGAPFEAYPPPVPPVEGVPDGRVVIPYGNWAASLLMGSASIAIAAGGWALRKLPGPIYWAVQQSRADKLLELAINYGVNAVAGAARGRALSVPVGSAVIERAAEYAVARAPKLVAELGGLAGLRDRLVARIEFEATAAVPPVRVG